MPREKRQEAGRHYGAYGLETTGRDGLGSSDHTWLSSSLLIYAGESGASVALI